MPSKEIKFQNDRVEITKHDDGSYSAEKLPKAGAYLRAESRAGTHGFEIPIDKQDAYIIKIASNGRFYARWDTSVDIAMLGNNGSIGAKDIDAPDRLDGYATVDSFSIIERE